MSRLENFSNIYIVPKLIHIVPGFSLRTNISGVVNTLSDIELGVREPRDNAWNGTSSRAPIVKQK